MKINCKKGKLSIVLIIVLLLIWGCNGNQRPSPEENKSKPPEVPETFTRMEEELLTTMFAIDGVAGLEKVIEEVEKAKKQVEMESEVELDAEEKKEPKKKAIDINMFLYQESTVIPLLEEEGIESDIVMVDDPPENIDSIWYQIDNLVASVHKNWNSLEPSLKKAGASDDSIRRFENYLSDTSVTVSNKDTLQSLMKLNRLSSYLNDFRENFTSKSPMQVYEVKYHLRQSVLMASQEDFLGAEVEIKKANDVGGDLKQPLVEKNKGDVYQQFKLSIEDYMQQLAVESFYITQVKGSIVMENIEKMIEVFESGK
ncbi:hypothetical protein F8154_09480 [Alkaliphilus pronyensis]|uniref:Uncharacterized protein n=1 Tax=Alkaliphilus pronyensis TaxID=1482732 RepID=A0A6I0F8E8_9FIRM|nr:hypothetical protein [Alkaliphilus pronyensis]KAB3534159.1 hypothetical protein F8154_09480 [Alkaliphilus pronyensis]